MHNLIYGGVNSEDYKAYITNAGIYKSPAKRYRNYTVPGRNGNLLEDTGTFKNVEVEYPFCVYEDCDTNMQNFLAAMRRKKGYQRIEDTFHPEYYRMGAFLDEFEPKEVTADADKSNGILKFDCMPQKWLKAGENEIVVWFASVTKRSTSGEQYDSMLSGDFKFPGYIDREMTMTMNCPSSVEVTIICNSMNDNNVVVDTQTYTCTNGDSVILEFYPTARYGSIELRVVDCSIDDVSATLDSLIVRGDDPDEKTAYSIPFVNELTLFNPTGYPTKPLFEFSGFVTTDITIENYVDGEIEETYQVKCLDDEPGTITVFEKAYLDCDMMYMYSGGGMNLSNRLQIITAEDISGRNLVFPKFGAETIKIKSLSTPHSDQTLPEWLPVMYITPRWWTI